MLFDTSFRRDLARSFGVTLVVLSTVFLTFVLIRTLSQTANGRFDPADVLLTMTYTGLGYLALMLALALFIAVVAAIGRLYRDSEMAVWLASGQPLRRFVGPVFRMAWPVLLAVLLLQLFVWPWAQQEISQMRERYEKRSDLSRVAPGQFQSSRDGSKVFFIERAVEGSGVGRNVFILTQQQQRESVTTAQQGEVQWQGEDRYLLLQKGQRNELDAAQKNHSLARFQQYRVLADRQATRALDEMPPKAMDSVDLLRSTEPRHWGQLVWRLGLALGAINLAFLGVGLAASNPRRPNNWGLVMALLVFIVYFLFINLSESWVATSKLSPGKALLLIHGVPAAAGLALLLWRDEALRLLGWRHRSTA